mmetsp:Transcript_6086/g.13272  ORF Transcript_6086/g.13272 Transcript_6086/m.13272 type:complete len:304 (+) Transcript_6086:118-1029(+)|eukprot:CAMPEP_0171343848 /NCGR_PEP_ID=MMETSP0878-20121228/18161_1 /TAXON_ID=67004 /ORGANISM="Thalassiosira weissflogii, Strain CCMP1336" /LENGTH=303 /DNA_ID=CAMNT_0011846887 /DNA_START=83 /DNA_END=994 /DNA_ORIENTATION=+
MTASRLSPSTTCVTFVGHPESRHRSIGQGGDGSGQEDVLVQLPKRKELVSNTSSANTNSALTAKIEIIEGEKVIIESDEDAFDIPPISQETFRYLGLVKSSSSEVERKLSIMKDHRLETSSGTPKFDNLDEKDNNLPRAKLGQRSMPVFLKVEKIDPVSSGFMASSKDRGEVFSLGRDVSARLNIPQPNRDQDTSNSEHADSMDDGCGTLSNSHKSKARKPERSRRRGEVNISQSSVHPKVATTVEANDENIIEDTEANMQCEKDIIYVEMNIKAKNKNATSSKKDKIYGAQHVEIVYSPTIN